MYGVQLPDPSQVIMKKEPETLQQAFEKLDEAIEDFKYELSQTQLWRFIEKLTWKFEMWLEEICKKR